MITDEKLAELEAAEAKATPGEWVTDGYRRPDGTGYFCLKGRPGGERIAEFEFGWDDSEAASSDIQLVALARNNLKALISEIRSDRRLQADMEAENKSIHEENQSLRAQLADAQGKLHEREAVLRMQAEWFNELTGAFGTGSAVEIKEKCDTLRAQLEIAKEALEHCECEWIGTNYLGKHSPKCRRCEALAKIEGG